MPSDNNSVTDACSTKAQSLQEGLPPSDLATIKDFLCFHIAIKQERINDKQTTVDSVNTFAK